MYDHAVFISRKLPSIGWNRTITLHLHVRTLTLIQRLNHYKKNHCYEYIPVLLVILLFFVKCA